MILRGGRSLLIAAGLLTIGCVFGSDAVVDPKECLLPAIVSEARETNPTNVLSQIVRIVGRDTDSIVVRFGVDDALGNVTPSFRLAGDSATGVVLGLLSDTNYRSQVVAFNRCGSATGSVVSFTTGSLPADLPSYRATGIGPAAGYVAFAAGNYGLVIDNSGRVVWYRNFPGGPGLNFQPQPNGRYAIRPPAEPGQQGRWMEIDPLGNITRTLTCANEMQPRLHDMIALPDGSYWLLCDEVRVVDLSAQGRSKESRVTGTGVQWRRATGEVLFQWSPFDHLEIDLSILDNTDLSGQTINWTHGNALDLDSAGNLLISFRNLSEVTKINTSTGAVIWRMGGTRNQFNFQNVATPAFTRQHGVRSVTSSRLLLLDNLGESTSRTEQYDFDQTSHTARMTGFYTSADGVIAQIGGSTQSLSAGHTLVSFGNGGGVEEYDQTGKLVWRIEGNPGYVFRAQRVTSLYSPGVGDRR